MTLLEKINALSANGGRNFTPKRVTFVILSLLMALSDVKAKVGKSLLLQDLTKKLNGKVMKFTNLFENDVIDGDRITHRELMFMGAKTSGTYNIRVIGKYLNIRREADGVTTILNSNLDTHGQESTLQIVAVSGAKYYIEGALTYLYCPYNQLTTLDVSKCTALTSLNCYDNRLTTLDVSKCTALTYLDCGRNQLTALDVSKCTALTNFSCYSNQLTALDVSKCTALTELNCNSNQLTALDVSKCTALTELDCNNNQLTSLDVSKCTALTELDCNNNQLTSLDVSKCTALTELDCEGNQLTALDVSKCTALTELDCEGNQLTALDVSKCTALTELNCNSNQLTMLYFGARQNEIQIMCYENNAPILNIAPNSSNIQILYSQSVTNEGLTAEQIRPMLNALHNVTNCLLALLDETGVVTAELADEIAVANSKGWQIITSM